ncbi:serine/threonine-protein kinase Nek4-like isoform X1 [Centruroides sculpturatus]|uniref:serine/threonine-protein kinase Nek4-like isoform X1 n=1 Tax=Centruroides sculpturatus TaxID=218467 RepID=UPI000C6E2711|nr:serine/threonine-protein kinase Nek4-like isoform X1 [Centruroides sculpturatus]XP_023222265.1 serine/threonine-protein kinase Nek4-like isoform X1 [Centruroides sculpturatus]XP_023222272.1 serine/threonine-protein kinase Nek4-like isoform X1 [Centruroides sculpturatus]XP_023222281.1 serine/threonine-protein kinase Nek4-like isoform X1 [Centruroides sculpturatus]
MENYTLVKKIGRGNYGEVWLIINKRNQKQYVLKQINMKNASEQEQRSAYIEVKLLSSLKHPNIVSYFDSFHNPNGTLDIIMGYCEKGDLYTYIRSRKGVYFQEKQIIEWFIQICMALQYLHERNILHRDLKTKNIFLTKSKIIKVGDLGIARILDGTCDLATTLIGTPYYMSPEIFSNQPYNHKSDIWALGCCLYEMSTLRHAFNAWDLTSLMYKIVQGQFPPMPKHYSTELTNLISSMLNYDPNTRPSVKSILQNEYMHKHIKNFLQETSNCSNQIKITKQSLPTQHKCKIDNNIKEESNTVVEAIATTSEINEAKAYTKNKISYPADSKKILFNEENSNNEVFKFSKNLVKNLEFEPNHINDKSNHVKNFNKKDRKDLLEMNTRENNKDEGTDKSNNSNGNNNILNKSTDFHFPGTSCEDINEGNHIRCKNLISKFQEKSNSNECSTVQKCSNNILFKKKKNFEFDELESPRRRRRRRKLLRETEEKHCEVLEELRPLPLPPRKPVSLLTNHDITASSETKQKSFDCFTDSNKKIDSSSTCTSKNLYSISKPNSEARRRRREKLHLPKEKQKFLSESDISSANEEHDILGENETKEEKNDVEIQEFIGLLNNTLQLSNQRKQNSSDYAKNISIDPSNEKHSIDRSTLIKSHIIQRIDLLKRDCIKALGENRLDELIKTIEPTTNFEILQVS